MAGADAARAPAMTGGASVSAWAEATLTATPVDMKAAAHTRAAVRKNIRDIVLDFEPFGEGSRRKNACVADVAGACAL